MFEHTSRLAEKLAASVSRRGFLGLLGGWAAAAMGVAALLTSQKQARTAENTCYFYNFNGGVPCWKKISSGTKDCPATTCFGWPLVSAQTGRYCANGHQPCPC